MVSLCISFCGQLEFDYIIDETCSVYPNVGDERFVCIDFFIRIYFGLSQV